MQCIFFNGEKDEIDDDDDRSSNSSLTTMMEEVSYDHDRISSPSPTPSELGDYYLTSHLFSIIPLPSYLYFRSRPGNTMPPPSIDLDSRP